MFERSRAGSLPLLSSHCSAGAFICGRNLLGIRWESNRLPRVY